MAHLLIIDDEQTLARNIARFLELAGHSASTAASLAEAQLEWTRLAPDAVVLDYQLPDGTGLSFIPRIRQLDAGCPILLLTGHGSIELAVEAMKAGATDFLTKPVSMAELRERLTRLLQQRREQSRLDYLESKDRNPPDAHPLIGHSPAMQQLRERIDRMSAAASSGISLPPVLITGETGVGKELVARACHQRSLGPEAPFVELNCAAIPEALLESELFGHERGAFTDARERKVGLMEAADGGSLFLDEIGEMSLALQAKLLKVLEDCRFRRVGGLAERQVQVRILAATNQALEQQVEQGRFRADLYFRLRVLTLTVPPLRERGDDVSQLADHFCTRFARTYRREGLAFSAEARAALLAHRWPGNVRELRNLVEQAVLLAPGPQIERQDLMLPVLPAASGPAAAGTAAGTPESGAGSSLDRLEREALIKALADAHDNVSQAARALGISRDTLRYRMDKHGLSRPPEHVRGERPPATSNLDNGAGLGGV